MASEAGHRDESGIVPSIARAIAVLDYVAAQEEPPTLAALSRDLQIPKSTTFGICRTLVRGQMLHQGRDGTFTMGVRLLQLATRSTTSNDLAQGFSHAAEIMVPKLLLTAQLAVLDRRSVYYIARVDGQERVPLASNTGRSLPASTTATGKAMLSTRSDDYVRGLYVERSDFPVLTPRSITSVDELIVELQTVRDRGYAIERGETMTGVLCVAAAVPAVGGHPQSAVSLTTHTERTETEVADYGSQAATMARLVSTLIDG